MADVSYKIASKLKKLGFKGQTNGYYVKKIPVSNSSTESWNEKGKSYTAIPNLFQIVNFLFVRYSHLAKIEVDFDDEGRVYFLPWVYIFKNKRLNFKYNLMIKCTSLEEALTYGIESILETL